MKIKQILAILAGMLLLYGVASADNLATYDVYVVGEYTCIDFGEWGQCLCPCATDCDTTLVGNQPPGIGGGPAVDDWIEVTPITTPTATLTSVPIPTNYPKSEPTREQPPISSTSTPTPVSTNTPIPATATPTRPTATDRPTSVPPTATSKPDPTATSKPTSISPTFTPGPDPTATNTPWDGGSVCHKKESAPGAVTGITKSFASHQKSAYDAHIGHGDSDGPCP